MGTMATMAIRFADGSYAYSYLHHDGHEAHATLVEWYNDIALAYELIFLGECRSLSNDIDNSEFYGRDWGEPYDDIKPLTARNMRELHQMGPLSVFDVASGNWVLR